MDKLRAAVLTVVLGLSSSFVLNVQAQQTTVYVHEDAAFKAGLELFQKQKYGSAQYEFRKVIESHPGYSLVRVDAEYYEAICAIELFNKDGELLLKDFVANHPESPRVRSAYYYLGKYNYRKKKYEDVIKWFEMVEMRELTKAELSELYFKRGHSYFEMGQFEKAKKDFYEIKDVDTKYSAPANYYYSHIAYLEKNYETALQGFNRLVNNASFGPVVPYYIAQIYYLQGKYNDVITYAPPLLDSANTKRAPEIARIIGESYYLTQRYKEAIPYFKKYEAGSSMYPKDNYVLAYSYYRTGDLDNAITYFKNTVAGNVKDTLAQNAYYHLGDCYVKKGNKDDARNAFDAAAKLDHDKQVKEDALWNYAKLSYELSYNPFSEAIEAFQQYIELYPKSARLDEAYAYLVNVYLTTKNYKDALASIEKMKTMNDQMKGAHQKVAYYRGVELFSGSSPDYDNAIKHFDKALTYKQDKNINALALYWKGEAWYRKSELYYKQNNKYNADFLEEALDNYMAFQSEPGAFNLPEFNNAYYGIGYSYLQLKDYSNANIWLRKYVNARKDSKDKKVSDAYVRIGDTYFMGKDFEGATMNYSYAIEMKARDMDYALYQRAMAYGVQQKRELKITDLQSLSKNFPKSNYGAAGKFEMAKTMRLVGKNEEALAEFQKIINDNPNSMFAGKALAQIGLIYYEQQQNDKALEYFVKVIKRDNRTEEAQSSYVTAKNIAAKKGDTEMVAQLAQMMGLTVSTAYLDSVAFDNAKKLYQELNCDAAVPALDNYLSKYPQGIFVLEANFYRGECLYKKNDLDAALSSYSFIISKDKNKYTEVSLAKAAYITHSKKNYQEAVNNYLKLEEISENQRNIMDSRIGLMRCYYQLKNYEGAMQYANKLIADEKTTAEVNTEAHMTIGRSALATEKYDVALNEFSSVAASQKNEMGAEAKYQVAYIRFLQSEFAESKKLVFELIKQYQSQPYWMAKGLILLADDYKALNDIFQARHTLQSVIDNSEFPELVKEAQQRLDVINEEEKQKNIKKLPSEDIKIDLNESKLEYQRLFIEPAEEDPVVPTDPGTPSQQQQGGQQ
jgi:tetratricopeptide (TPR) repeat protein